MAYIRLGELLKSSGIISDEQLEAALKLQKQTKQRLGDILLEYNFITNAELIEALQMQLGIDYIDLTTVSIPVELTRFVPRKVAKERCIVPVRLADDSLYIAMSDPLDFIAQEAVKKISGKKVVPVIAAKKAVEQAIATLYGSEGTARAIEDMKREMTNADILPARREEAADEDINKAPTIRFVNSIIERAFLERASDIHIEPQREEVVVRMRIDGRLHKILTVPSDLQSTVISRLKIMGGMNISERKTPQDGHAMVTVKDHSIDIRMSVMPTVYGEKVVLRLLDKSSGEISKKTIGLRGEDESKYDALLQNSNGIILLVGPTGSGKSTTMCAMLSELAGEEVNIVTLEDPVEYDIRGVNQCQINEKTGMTFANGLMAILRQDPDIIGVGEIRDGETAAIAARAAITGHLVLSTLHTNDSISAVHRLMDIGVEPYMISSALKGVISQRLVRKICPHCRDSYVPTDDEKRLLGISQAENIKLYRGEGCPECHHSGYMGRQAVFEILTLTKKMRHMISEGVSEEALLEEAETGDFRSMKEACKTLVLEGITTAGEALRAINSTAD